MRLLLLFVVLPLVELQLLLAVGVRIGAAATVLLVLLTGVAGASLARQQGLAAWQRIHAELAAGRQPAASLLEGLVILVAGVVLLTPGFLTDVAGLLCLFPPTRARLIGVLQRRLERSVEAGRVHVHFRGAGPAGPLDDLEPRIIDREVIQHEPEGDASEKRP